ncbi:MscL family protein [Streptomyces sp. DSM 44917]|uniref:MscL family protein n=1 Tax=Streptomyces boetiae TaxID=3075541 RepID=A0ABU2LDI7_9ACTN|nr:MscL family protein [Streptomyces sp. DSM 44917]MDT0309328.1 MscL family protein [Streptomyces sp. DSM 44917]
MRGNVVELAVAVVIGAAFTSIVNSVVEGVINPLVGAFGTQDLGAYQSCLRGPCEVNEAGQVVQGIPIRWGLVLSASLTFLITAGVVYFLMILPMTRYLERRGAKAPEQPPAMTEVDLLTEIRDELIAQRAARSGAVTVGAQRSGEDGPAPSRDSSGPGAEEGSD